MPRHAFPPFLDPGSSGAHGTLARPGRAVSLALLVALGACGSEPAGGSGGDAGALRPGDAGGGSDAGPGGAPVAHVPAEGAWAGTGRLILQDGAVIDTDSLTIDGQAYAGARGDAIVFDDWAQLGDAPELAVLHVGDFGVEGGTVTVRGARPLVIIASMEIRLAGMLDASARAQAPGPGGHAPGTGPQPGADGRHAGAFQDGGGGGGGHGSDGGKGGAASCAAVDDCATGGLGGTAYFGTEPGLQGGSGGGTGAILSDEAECVPGLGGAGGGAVQLTAVRIRIEPTGGVHAGGGGGAAGAPDNLCGENGGGGGGGAGGAIFLQSPDIQHRGVLAANGGGGGAGASESRQSPGADALASAEPAPGGASVNDFGHAGGCGDALTGQTCVRDGSSGEGNAGGGGGGAGRITALTVPNGYDGLDSVASPMVDVRTE